MAKVNRNFSDDILELIGSGEVFNKFDPNLGHYVKVTIRKGNQWVADYSSHLTWQGRFIYYDNHTAYYVDNNAPVEDPYNEIQVPLYYDSVDGNGYPTENSNLFIKHNDILELDPGINYTNSKYTLTFNFFDNIFNHFVDTGIDYACNIPGHCSGGGYETENECVSYGVCYTGTGNCSGSPTGDVNGQYSEIGCTDYGTCYSVDGVCTYIGHPTDEFSEVYDSHQSGPDNEEACIIYGSAGNGWCLNSVGETIGTYWTNEECLNNNSDNTFHVLTTSWEYTSTTPNVTSNSCDGDWYQYTWVQDVEENVLVGSCYGLNPTHVAYNWTEPYQSEIY